MRVYRNASIDRLMARKSERLSQSSSVFDNYLTGFLNNKNYGYFGNYGNYNNFGIFNNTGNSSNIFDALNTSNVQYNLLQAQRKLAAERVENTISSGEPLRGVSYNEYLTYYLEKNGSLDTKAAQFYKQDLKGDKAALRDKQWRTDPDYIIPERLYNNSLITADRDAAIEKLAKNEKLEDWEQRLLDTVKGKN